jgi:hypothetical protein
MLAACGDDDDSPTVEGSSDDGGSGSGDADVTIDMAEYSYEVSGDLPAGGTLHLKNSGEQLHMLGIGKLAPGKTAQDAVQAIESESEEDDAATLTEVSMPSGILGPGQESDVTAPSFGAGSYVLLCFLPVEGEDTPHFVKGMVGSLSVTDEKAEAPKADATYTAAPGKAIEGPDELEAGHQVLELHRSDDGDGLEPGLIKLDDGTTVEEFASAMAAFDDGPLPKGAAGKIPGELVTLFHDFGPDSSVFLGVDLEPGTYVLVAQDSDLEDVPDVPVERIEIKVA